MVTALDLGDARLAGTAAASVAVAGMSALPLSPDREVPRGVLSLLEEENRVIRESGACLLNRLGSTSPEVVAALTALRDDENRMASVVLEMLGRSGGDGDSPATQRLTSEYFEVRWQEAVWLSREDEAAAAVPVLREGLRRHDPRRDGCNRRRFAETAAALGRIGEAAGAAVEELDALLQWGKEQPDSDVAVQAAGALCLIAGPTQERVDVLLSALDQAVRGSPSDRWWTEDSVVTDVLPHIAHRLDPALKRQVSAVAGALLEAHHRWNRRRLVGLLGDFGEDAAIAVPQLAKMLAETEARWQRYLTVGGDDDSESGIAPGDLARLWVQNGPAFSETFEARLYIADALEHIGPAARDAIPVLEKMVAEGDDVLRYVAARVLRRIRAP